ncbi:MAG: ABC transporter substrate-binding protein [Acutalibacteraceae bacterium]|nr:ABC transporter substrate-binding protein [Acutalibacteraceae bacterium]
MKRLLSLFLIVTLCLCVFSGCKGNEVGNESGQGSATAQNQSDESINLLYCSNDTFNPYTLITKVNLELCQLLYDSLITLDNNFEPVYKLAHSASMEGKVWTVVLKDAVFSDGSILTGEDVVYSFNLAKNHSRYSSCLSHVSSVSSEGAKITFTLSSTDPYFINLLDFPILKAGSDNIENEDSVLLPPISVGRYVLNEDETKLIRNESYYSAKPKYKTINLINAPDSESVAHYVEVGATDFYYANINDGKIIRMDGKKFSINQNRLIYIGVNMNNSVLKDVKVRYGISAALDRKKIVSSAYFDNAIAATGPFTPVFKETKSYQTIETSANNKIAIENFEQIGYNILDNSGLRKNRSGYPLSFSLLINGDNNSQSLAAQLIKSQLMDVGINITINALSYENYKSALESGSFQLYLGEVKLSNNFDISPLIVKGGSCAYSVADVSDENVTDFADIISKYKNGEASISDVITSVSSQLPFIPICYRCGILFYSDSVGEVNDASVNDLFVSIQN